MVSVADIIRSLCESGSTISVPAFQNLFLSPVNIFVLDMFEWYRWEVKAISCEEGAFLW